MQLGSPNFNLKGLIDDEKDFSDGRQFGIALAIAEALVARGDEVWGTSRNLIRLEDVRGVHPVRLDLGDSRSI